MIYVVGIVKSNLLKHLCMVYSRDYCASNEIYERIKSTIKKWYRSNSQHRTRRNK